MAIVTEVESNPGLSITNGIEYIAAALSQKFNLQPKDLVLVEHYHEDKILPEHYHVVKFRDARHNREGWKFSEPQWIPVEKSELDRLIGIQSVLSGVDYL